MRIRIEGYGAPADLAPQVHVGVQRLKDVEQLTSLEASTLSWEVDADVHRTAHGGVDLRGPYVHGRRGGRFLYLSWGLFHAGAFGMSRRAKLMLSEVDDVALVRAAANDLTLVGRLSLTGKDGTPVCAAVRPPAISWTVD